MNVETTSRRVDWFLKLFDEVGLGEAGASWLSETVPLRRNRLVATLPADGWYLLSRLMGETIFGPRGGINKLLPAYKMSAMQEVQAAVNLRTRHPAIGSRPAAVVGVAREILPVWVDPSGRSWPLRRTMPYQAEFKVLVPCYIPSHGITNWIPVWGSADIPAGVDARLFEESEHLRFSVQVDSGR